MPSFETHFGKQYVVSSEGWYLADLNYIKKHCQVLALSERFTVHPVKRLPVDFSLMCTGYKIDGGYMTFDVDVKTYHGTVKRSYEAVAFGGSHTDIVAMQRIDPAAILTPGTAVDFDGLGFGIT